MAIAQAARPQTDEYALFSERRDGVPKVAIRP